MIILQYILHRLKGISFGLDEPDYYPVTCHRCEERLILTAGLERQQLEYHFESEDHKTRSRENGF